MRHDDLSLSIILPVFIREKAHKEIDSLCHAIESLINQDYPDTFEIIIIDDGSPFPAEQMAKACGMPKGDNIHWIRYPKNNGVSYASNIGLKWAKYHFFARMDADDRWMPKKISKQMHLFKQDGDLSLSATGMTVVDRAGKTLREVIYPGHWEHILLLMAHGTNPIPNGSVVGLTSIVKLLGGYPHRIPYAYCSGDYFLWSHWVRFFKPCLLEEPLYVYTKSDSSITGIYKGKMKSTLKELREDFASAVHPEKLPKNMENLAKTLGIGLLPCGVICYRMWRFGPRIRIPRDALDVIKDILPDRHIVVERADPSGPCHFFDMAHGFVEASSQIIGPEDSVTISCY